MDHKLWYNLMNETLKNLQEDFEFQAGQKMA